MITNIAVCPQCGSHMEVDERYKAWCSKCNWNVYAAHKFMKFNKNDLIFNEFNIRLSKPVLDDILCSGKLLHDNTSEKIAAYLISLAVFALPLIFGLLGALLINYASNALHSIIGFSFIFIAIFLFPVFRKQSNVVISKEEYPMIYELASNISQNLDAKEIDIITYNHGLQNSFTKSGFPPSRILNISIPIFAISNMNEKIAMLSHEIAQDLYNDLSKSSFICSALNTLSTWYWLTKPKTRAGFINIFMKVINLLRVFICFIILLVWRLLGALVWKDKQKAEYLADQAAAGMTGTEAVISALGKPFYYSVFESAIKSDISNNIKINLFSDVKERIKNLPDNEKKRIQALQNLEVSALDPSQPPLSYRKQHLKNNYILYPRMYAGVSDVKKLEEELSRLEYKVQKEILDMYRAGNLI